MKVLWGLLLTDIPNAERFEVTYHGEQNLASSRSDAEIIDGVLKGEVNAFELLLSRYAKLVASIVRRHIPTGETEDVIQAVFVSVYQALAGLKERDRFQPWLSAIAVRTCYDYWRRRYRSKEVPMSALSQSHQDWLEQVFSQEPHNGSEAQVARKEARELLDWALSRVTAEDRIVLELLYLEERSVKETAALLGWSIPNVKVRAFRSRRKLEKLLRGVLQQQRRAP